MLFLPLTLTLSPKGRGEESDAPARGEARKVMLPQGERGGK